MSDLKDIPAETPLSPEEAVIRRHRREKKELQGKVLSMKKAITKNDKKKKKDISDEIVQLEAELVLRHKIELDSFGINRVEEKCPSLHPVLGGVSELTLDDDKHIAAGELAPTPGIPRMSKAQKRREKKNNEERERQKRIEKETDELVANSDKKKENCKLKEILKDMNLRIYEIPPDGHCVYAAISHQLEYHHSISESVASLRNKTSSYLLQHRDDFINYLDGTIINSQVNFENYCKDIRDTPCWGGQIEIQVLSSVLEKQIRIIQADGPFLMFGDKYTESCLNLIFHRHMLQLGAHYNSTISQTETH